MNDYGFNEKYQFTITQDPENDQRKENLITSIEPVEPKKKHLSLKIIAITLGCMLFMFCGGVIGIQIADKYYSGLLNNNEVAQASDNAVAKDNKTEPLGGFNSSGATLSMAELFDGANPAVVAVSTEVTGRNAFGQTVTQPAAGSGFIISEDGYIVTNNHVIENADSITIQMYDDKQYPATLVGSDSLSDLAVLKIDAKDLSYLTFGDSDALKVGEPVVAIGNPLGEFANSLTAGYVSSLDREINIDGIPRHMIQTDAAVNSGNSGGPLLNMKGQAIGVVSAKSSGMNVEGLGFAIPSNQIKDMVNQLIEDGYVSGRASMGVLISGKYNNNQSYVYVESVTNGSAAEKGGVKAGDIILAANGKEISSTGELRALISEFSPGDEFKLEIQRGSEKITLTLILDEYKPTDSASSNNNSNPPQGDSQLPDTFDPWSFFPGMQDGINPPDSGSNNDNSTDNNTMQYSGVDIDKDGNVKVKDEKGEVIYTGKLDKNGNAVLYNDKGQKAGEITVTNNGYSIILYGNN